MTQIHNFDDYKNNKDNKKIVHKYLIILVQRRKKESHHKMTTSYFYDEHQLQELSLKIMRTSFGDDDGAVLFIFEELWTLLDL